MTDAVHNDILTMMVALGCDANQAKAEYAAIEAFLILRETPIPASMGMILADKVNVRAKPGLQAPVILQVKQGDVLQVWGSTPVRDWLCVVTDPPGWIAAEYVKV